MNFLAKQLIGRNGIGHCLRANIGVQVALFNRSSQLLKESTNTQKTIDEELNKPINYFGSKAATWKARESHGSNDPDDDMWYQPIVISASVGVFLIYFCILREESDIDAKFDMTLYDHIEGLEEHQLEATLKYNINKGLPTLDVENRLKELRTNKI